MGFEKEGQVIGLMMYLGDPEDLELVEHLLVKNKSKLKILDIGIGSGCLLLSILKERKKFWLAPIINPPYCKVCNSSKARHVSSHKFSIRLQYLTN